jgi:hypothetical protein
VQGLSAKAASRLAWIVFGVAAALFLANLAYLVSLGKLWSDPFPMTMFSFAVVGVLIAARHPRNSIGWIMLGVGLVWGLGIAADLATRPGASAEPPLVLALTAGSWVPGIAPIGSFLILLFPDGHLPSPRWRPWAWLCGIAIFGSYLMITIAPGNFADEGHPGVSNPLGIEALRPIIGVVFLFIVLIPISFLGCALSLVQRLRRSQGQERLQLKWLAAAGTAVAFLYLVTIAVSLPYELTTADMPAWLGVLQNLGIYSFLLIPVAVGVAILRHRLYDIDVIINRALVYGVLSAILTAAYLIGATLLQELFRPVTGDSSLAVATSTLAAAALFRPARARVQTFIDRRFYRTKYDAAQTVERFSSRLRNEVDLDALTAELVAVVGDTMQPAHVSLWLRRPQQQSTASE